MNLPPCNFRPVLPVSVPNKPPNLYRSNAIDDGTNESARWLRETIGINAYLDLREENEFCPTSKLAYYFIQRTPEKSFKTQEATQQPYGNRFHIRFITFFYHVKILFYRLKLNQICKIIVLLIQHLFYKNYEYQKYGGQCYLSSMSLGDFYCSLLDDCRNVFRKIFLLMTNEANFPMLISCSFGKDRTGLVSALVMNLLGYEDQMIVDEYTKSEENLKILEKEIEQFFSMKGVGKRFCGAPAEAIIRVMLHIKEKYGNAEGYLKHCGLKDEQIERVKTNLIN